MKAAPKALATALAAFTALGTLAVSAAPASAVRTKDCGKSAAIALEAVALTKAGQLLCVDVAHPGTARLLGKAGPLDAGTKLVDIDIRPETGRLYGLGSNGALYTLSLKNAVATKVANGLKKWDDATAFALSGHSFGMNFNPAVDRLRVVSDTGMNIRINPADGVTYVDSPLANTVPGGAATGVTGLAYTNNDPKAVADTNSSMFAVDTAYDRMQFANTPNSGQLVPTGPLGRNVDADNGFDIYTTLAGGKARTNTAFAAFSNGTRSTLYTVDLFGGGLTKLGAFAKKRGEIIGLTLPLNQR
ncbi:MAG TPA: DUF4394 domain-containing protein [Sporichthya sp.]|nr:DUF4394 domain-containing protein [Sporichthya sp.]